jgi:hypothetical protein
LLRTGWLALGGTPAGYADADVDSWERTLAVLDRTLAPDRTAKSDTGLAIA